MHRPAIAYGKSAALPGCTGVTAAAARAAISASGDRGLIAAYSASAPPSTTTSRHTSTSRIGIHRSSSTPAITSSHISRATSVAAANAAATITPNQKNLSVTKSATIASSGNAHSIAAAHRVPRATNTHAPTTAATRTRSLSTQHFFRGIPKELGIESFDRLRRERGAVDQPRVAAELQVAHFFAVHGEAH